MVAINRTSPLPLHRQIYTEFRSAILEGRLRPGQRIPSTRVLATEIHVSRFPVLNAYAQLLAEGYLESRVGAGTVISSSLPEHLTPSHPGSTPVVLQRRGRQLSARSSVLPRKQNLPWIVHLGAFRVAQVAFDQFPHQIWSNLVARRSRAMDANSAHYGDVMGNASLRRAIANYLKIARSVRCEPEQVLVVNGSQQALEITARVLLDPGSRVWIEEPSYRLAQDVFRLNGCELVPVPVDEEGLDVAAGIAKCRKARAAFVSPSHQFPLGVTMSASRRLRLIEWAQSSGAWIIEDDYDSEFRHSGAPLSAVQGLAADAPVIYLGTFSKMLFPALRLGYMVVPPELVPALRLTAGALMLRGRVPEQLALAEFIEAGHFTRHLRRMRRLYGERRDALQTALQTHLSGVVTVSGGAGGMHLSTRLDAPVRDVDVTVAARAHGMVLRPLSRFCLPGTQSAQYNGLVLGYGNVPAKAMDGLVMKMRQVIEQVAA